MGLSSPKLTVLIKHLKLKDNVKYCKQITIGKSKFDRYSQEAISKIKDEMLKINIEKLWQEHRPRCGSKSAK